MDLENLNKRLADDAENEDYIGNMWGWKFSFFGLAIIIITGLVLWYGHVTGGADFYEGIDGHVPTKVEAPEPVIDSLVKDKK